MEDLTNVEKIIENIGVNKEILSTMPQNNEKNKKIYKEKIEEIKKEYEKYKSDILDIFSKRYNEEINISIDKSIENFSNRLNTIKNLMYLLNDEQTSYEKMGLDINIYKLEKYYKENLENVNEQIASCIEKFHMFGIELNIEDFNYVSYVKEYMEVFLQELQKDDIHSKKLKTAFEQIYWKCPDIIRNIALNFRNIYLTKQNIIDKYFEKEKNEILKKWAKNPSEIKKTYIALKQQKIEKEAIDKKIIIDNFLNGTLNTKNYTKEKFKSNCLKILPQKIYAKINKDEDIYINISKFLNSLYEYKNFENFKFIIKDMKEYCLNKDKYKKAYEQTKKKVEIEEKKLKKLSKRNGFFGRKKESEKNVIEQNEILKNIEELYKQLDLDKFYQKASTELNKNSTIYEAFTLAISYYNYMVSCMIKYKKDITQEEMDMEIENLREFLNSPYNTIINNITIAEEKDIAIIIKDRYKLLNFVVEKEDFEAGNIENLISTIKDIQIFNNLKKANLKVEDIEEIIKMKKILKL